jgi:hypothetical protein
VQKLQSLMQSHLSILVLVSWAIGVTYAYVLQCFPVFLW